MSRGLILEFRREDAFRPKRLADFETARDYEEYVRDRCQALLKSGQIRDYDQYLRELTAESIENLFRWMSEKSIDPDYARSALREHLKFLLTR
ncbi:hypothetical protein [Pseudorhodoplanes sp.]|uniref:hypothetical protein n=1 Tax=Pseudorhodoplanes sp. TaxID=1934341 RepID=UPI003D0D4A91